MIHSKPLKVLLCFGLLLSGCNLLTYAFPIAAGEFLGETYQDDRFHKTLNILAFVTYGLLAVRIWTNKGLNRSQKGQWTVFCAMLPMVFGLYFLWKEEKKLKVQGKEVL